MPNTAATLPVALVGQLRRRHRRGRPEADSSATLHYRLPPRDPRRRTLRRSSVPVAPGSTAAASPPVSARRPRRPSSGRWSGRHRANDQLASMLLATGRGPNNELLPTKPAKRRLRGRIPALGGERPMKRRTGNIVPRNNHIVTRGASSPTVVKRSPRMRALVCPPVRDARRLTTEDGR